jgi:hypothetical protein
MVGGEGATAHRPVRVLWAERPAYHQNTHIRGGVTPPKLGGVGPRAPGATRRPFCFRGGRRNRDRDTRLAALIAGANPNERPAPDSSPTKDYRRNGYESVNRGDSAAGSFSVSSVAA